MAVGTSSSPSNAFVIPTKPFATTKSGTNNSNTNSNSNNQFSYASTCELRSTSRADESVLEVLTDNSVDTALKTSSAESKEAPFVNDGLFAWMQPYLDLFGFVEGNTVYYGPGVAADPSKAPSTEDQERLRADAIESMTNIGADERERRREGGEIASRAAIAYALVSSIFLDDGSLEGHFVRLGLALVRTSYSVCICYSCTTQAVVCGMLLLVWG